MFFQRRPTPKPLEFAEHFPGIRAGAAPLRGANPHSPPLQPAPPRAATQHPTAGANALFGGNKAQGQELTATPKKNQEYPICLRHGDQFMTLKWRIVKPLLRHVHPEQFPGRRPGQPC